MMSEPTLKDIFGVDPNAVCGTDKHYWYLMTNGGEGCPVCNRIRKERESTESEARFIESISSQVVAKLKQSAPKELSYEVHHALAAALSFINWSQFGSCRSPGWDGPPPSASEVADKLNLILSDVWGKDYSSPKI